MKFQPQFQTNIAIANALLINSGGQQQIDNFEQQMSQQAQFFQVYAAAPQVMMMLPQNNLFQMQPGAMQPGATQQQPISFYPAGDTSSNQMNTRANPVNLMPGQFQGYTEKPTK